jgi:hypothetical protein
MSYAEIRRSFRPRSHHRTGKEDAMIVRRVVFFAMLAVTISSALPSAQTGGTVSYKVDGKAFAFKDGRLEYYKGDGYISLVGERVEMVADPSGPEGEKREITVGMTIQLAKSEDALAGEHRSSTPDEMPTHFSWYEIVPTEDKKAKEIKEYLASLDSGDESVMVIRLKIDKFGPPGSLIQGTFSGKLFDEDGKLHEITDGVFSVPRKDMD